MGKEGDLKYKKYRLFAEASLEVANMNAREVHEDTMLVFMGSKIRAKITVKPLLEPKEK